MLSFCIWCDLMKPKQNQWMSSLNMWPETAGAFLGHHVRISPWKIKTKRCRKSRERTLMIFLNPKSYTWGQTASLIRSNIWVNKFPFQKLSQFELGFCHLATDRDLSDTHIISFDYLIFCICKAPCYVLWVMPIWADNSESALTLCYNPVRKIRCYR